VYADFYGVTFWESLPVSMDEIKVIEVILGPGSAYHGANAFACVVNIITFRPDELEGTRVRGVVESTGTFKGTVIHSGGGDDVVWRVSSTQAVMRNMETDEQEGDGLRLNAKVQWSAGEDTRLTFGAGGTSGIMYFVPSSQALDLDGQTGYQSALLEWRDLRVLAFRNTWNLDVIPRGDVEYLDLSSELDADVAALELNHVIRPGGGHRLQWGGEVRRKNVSWVFDDNTYTQNIWSAFLADEWRACEGLLLSLGARYDDHPLVGGHVAPRAGVVFRPGASHTLRASYGVAYRDPSYLESYWSTEVSAIPGYTQFVHGGLDLESEEIRSLEVGYQGMLTPDVLASVVIFRNEVSNIIDMDVVATYPSPPAFMPGIPSEMAFINDDDWVMLGMEYSLETRLGDRVGVKARWSVTDADMADGGGEVLKTPRHIGGATVTWDVTPHHSLALRGQHRSRTTFRVGSLYGTSDSEKAGDRTVLDLTWHWNPRGGATHVTAGVLNLLDEHYRDLPLAMVQERRARLSVRTEF